MILNLMSKHYFVFICLQRNKPYFYHNLNKNTTQYPFFHIKEKGFKPLIYNIHKLF